MYLVDTCTLLYNMDLISAYVNQDTRAEGRGRIARHQRRLLVVEVEKKIMQYQTFIDQGLVRSYFTFFLNIFRVFLKPCLSFSVIVVVFLKAFCVHHCGDS